MENKPMPARLNAYPTDRPVLVRLVGEDKRYRIGRASDCEVVIDHPSVSRFHAELLSIASGWYLRDTDSKNGLHVNGQRVSQVSAREPMNWFAIGDVHCSLELLDTEAAKRLIATDGERRANARLVSGQLSTSRDVGSLLSITLEVLLELSGLDRGFVLYAPRGEPLRVRATRGLLASDLVKAEFTGSVTAVEQALATRQCVVCCDTEGAPWLGSRPSVRHGGIRAIMCIPLFVGQDALGVIYADSWKPGPPLTELDLELVSVVADQASAILGARRLRDEVDELLKRAKSRRLRAIAAPPVLARGGRGGPNQG